MQKKDCVPSHHSSSTGPPRNVLPLAGKEVPSSLLYSPKLVKAKKKRSSSSYFLAHCLQKPNLCFGFKAADVVMRAY